MMHRVLFVLACATLAAALIALPDELAVRNKFNEYRIKFNKEYAAEEIDQRYTNFKASLARVAEMNKDEGATFGINKFSDLSVEEFRAQYLMANKPQPPKEIPEHMVLKPKFSARQAVTFVDWRDKGVVTDVKNQQQCGSCWAFSATETIESQWLLAGKGTLNNTNYAPQQIVDCDTSDNGCGGGNPYTAYEYVIGAGGMESNESYPYTAESEACHFDASLIVGGTISNWKYATTWWNEQTLLDNFVSWGPISICVDASKWQDYTGGVMTGDQCAWFPILDHCVQLVGYNATDSNNEYYMVRNSWGTDWGVEGYIWLQMGVDACGLAHEATVPIV